MFIIKYFFILLTKHPYDLYEGNILVLNFIQVLRCLPRKFISIHEYFKLFPHIFKRKGISKLAELNKFRLVIFRNSTIASDRLLNQFGFYTNFRIFFLGQEIAIHLLAFFFLLTLSSNFHTQNSFSSWFLFKECSFKILFLIHIFEKKPLIFIHS